MSETLNRDFKGVWIPKEIWLAEDIGWTAKMLLVEIDSLAQNGECFASNQHFANFFSLSKDRISRLVSELKEKGYIEVKLIYKSNGKQIDKRIITTNGYRQKCLSSIVKNNDTIVENNNTPIVGNNDTPIVENNNTPIVENNKDNNTDINNTDINNINNNTNKQNATARQSSDIEQIEQEFENLWSLYPNKKGKASALKAYAKARRNKPELYQIVENGIKSYAAYVSKEKVSLQYIKHGSTWFNQQCWNDDYETGGNTHGGNAKYIEDSASKWGAFGLNL